MLMVRNKAASYAMAGNEAFARQFATRLAVSASSRPTPPPKQSKDAALPACTLKYALAIADPLSPAARGACIPVGSNATQKSTAIIRLDTVFNANGVCAFLVAPCLANNLPSVYYTTSAYTGTTSTDLFPFVTGSSQVNPAVLATGWAVASHNGPYINTDLAYLGLTAAAAPQSQPTISGRIVSAGARLQYTGTTLNESGMYTCLHDPTHLCTSGQDVTSIQGSQDAIVEGISRTPCMLRMYSIRESEMNFPTLEPSGQVNGSIDDDMLRNLYPYTNGPNWRETNAGSDIESVFYSPTGAINTGSRQVAAPTGVIVATGKAGESLHLEMVLHLEFIGTRPSAFYTPVTADPQGAQLVRTAALTMPAKMQANPRTGAWDAILSGIRAGWHELKPILVPAAKVAAETAVLAMMA